MVVQVRQALHFADIGVVHPQPALRVSPFADPALRVGHDVLDLENFTVFGGPSRVWQYRAFPDRSPAEGDEQLGGFMDEHAETRFGRDLLAIAGRGEVSRKAEAS